MIDYICNLEICGYDIFIIRKADNKIAWEVYDIQPCHCCGVVKKEAYGKPNFKSSKEYSILEVSKAIEDAVIACSLQRTQVITFVEPLWAPPMPSSQYSYINCSGSATFEKEYCDTGGCGKGCTCVK